MKDAQLSKLQARTIQSLQHNITDALKNRLTDAEIDILELLIENVVMNAFWEFNIPAHIEN
jgi:hypothetical protein